MLPSLKPLRRFLSPKLPLLTIAPLFFSNPSFSASFDVATEAELRDALVVASSNGESDWINLNGSVIQLTFDEATETGGQLVVNAEFGFSLKISDGTLTRDTSGPQFRLVKVVTSESHSFPRMTFSDMIFENGFYDTNSGPATEAGGGAVLVGEDGAIFQKSTFRNNTVFGSGRGGAILSNGPVRMAVSHLIDNRVIAQEVASESSGGALALQGNDESNLRSSTINTSIFESNSAVRGGAVYAIGVGTHFFNRSAFINNEAVEVGGAFWSTVPRLWTEYNTIYNNTAGEGGGAFYTERPLLPNDRSQVIVAHSTIVGNSGGSNGGVMHAETSFVSISLVTSILYGNGTNCSVVGATGPLTVNGGGGTLIDDDTCLANPALLAQGVADFIRVDSSTDIFETGLLENNPGPLNTVDFSATSYSFMPSIALSPTSLAIDNGGVGTCISNGQITGDALGNPVLGDLCDSGALEHPNPLYLDADQDGVLDVDDAFPLDPAEQSDTDSDDIGDNADLDDDADGQLDTDEVLCGSHPLDNASISADADDDGIPDCVDTDMDGDGQLDSHEMDCGSNPLDAASLSPDFDSDGVPDCTDDDFAPDNDGGDEIQGNIDATTPLNINSWGSGFNGTFQYEIQESDTAGGTVREWSVEVGTSESVQISNAWMSGGYNASISTISGDNTFTITNEGQGYISELSAGDVLTFSIQGAGGDLNDAELYLNFTALSQTAPVAGVADGCANPTPISLPFSQDGQGEFCWTVSGSMNHINSWGVSNIEINGESFTNQWSNSFPNATDGGYTIYYQADKAWSHFEISGSN